MKFSETIATTPELKFEPIEQRIAVIRAQAQRCPDQKAVLKILDELIARLDAKIPMPRGDRTTG